MKNGLSPVCLKVAKVLPLFKKGDKDNPNNYRPIAILSPVCKVFEKIIQYRFTSFLVKNNYFFLPISLVSCVVGQQSKQ